MDDQYMYDIDYTELDAIEKSEKRHHESVRAHVPLGGGNSFVSKEVDFIKWLDKAESLVDAIASNMKPLYLAKTGLRQNTFYELTAIGTRIVGIVTSFDHSTASYYSNHQFNPKLDLMIRAARKFQPEIAPEFQSVTKTFSEFHNRKLLDDFAAYVGSESRTKEFKSRLKNSLNKQKKNIDSCCRYMAALFAFKSKLLVLRIDLYAASTWGYTAEYNTTLEGYLRAMREGRIVPDVEGFIAKREDGIDRGVHIHLLVVLDGQLHWDAANLTKTLGEEWMRRCNGSAGMHPEPDRSGLPRRRGTYFNCYTRVSQYAFNCLGLIQPSNAKMMKGLRLAIEYMCKETMHLIFCPLEVDADGHLVPPAVKKRIRNLRKGNMPKTHSGRGAPRSTNADTTMIEQILLSH